MSDIHLEMCEPMPTGAEPDAIDPDDEQFVAEEFDEGNIETDIDLDDYGPDHGLAAMEASVVLRNGEVPLDSMAERDWREEPEEIRPSTSGFNEELIEAHPDWGFDPDFGDGSEAGFTHEMPTGIAVGEVGGPVDTVLPAEEAAMHVTDGEEPERI